MSEEDRPPHRRASLLGLLIAFAFGVIVVRAAAPWGREAMAVCLVGALLAIANPRGSARSRIQPVGVARLGLTAD